MTETESMKSVLSSIFRRRGGETAKTKLFDNLPQQVRTGLLREVSIPADDVPVLASVVAGDHWVLVTTRRLYFNRAGNVTTIDLSELKDATVAIGLDAAKGISRKRDLTSLKLTLRAGAEHVIEVEPGPPHVGIWNVLKHFGARNAKKCGNQ